MYHCQTYCNFNLECKHDKHKTALRARKGIGTFEKRAPAAMKTWPRSLVEISLIRLDCLPVRCRIEYKILILNFKAIYGVAPSYICNLITIKERTRYNLRSSKELLLEPPLVKTKKTLGDKSFQVAAPRLWNKLPSGIRAIRGYDLFKGEINT